MERVHDLHEIANHLFGEGDPRTAAPATRVPARWLNQVQEELLSVVLDAGLGQSKTQTDQLRQAIEVLARRLASGRKNVLDNADMALWRRGQSRTFPQTDGLGAYGPDRWRVFCPAGGSAVVSRQTHAASDGRRYYMRVDYDGGGGATNFVLHQRLESVLTLAGETASLSFRARTPDAAATYPVIVRVQQQMGTGGAPSATLTYARTMRFGPAWQVFRFQSIALDDLAGSTLGTDPDSDHVQVELILPTTAFRLDLDWMQLEAGPYATPLEPVPVWAELLASMRTWQSSYPIGVDPGTVSAAGALRERMFVESGEPFAAAGGVVWGELSRTFLVPMRRVPVVTWWNPDTGAQGSIAAETVAAAPADATWSPNASPVGASRTRTGAAHTTGAFPVVGALVQSRAHFTADAEFITVP